jgi:hypothetical protein
MSSWISPIVALAERAIRPLLSTTIDIENAPPSFTQDCWRLAQEWLRCRREDDTQPLDSEWLGANKLLVSDDPGDFASLKYGTDRSDVCVVRQPPDAAGCIFLLCVENQYGTRIELSPVFDRGDVRRYARWLDFPLLTDLPPETLLSDDDRKPVTQAWWLSTPYAAGTRGCEVESTQHTSITVGDDDRVYLIDNVCEFMLPLLNVTTRGDLLTLVRLLQSQA